MKIRPKKQAPAWKGQQQAAPVQADIYTFPAPMRGWIQNENLLAVQPGGASVLDNWICTSDGARVRGGSLRHATVGEAVASLMTYKTNTEMLFAATASAIYDITAPAAPDVAPTAAVTGLTSGDFSSAQFGTVGGDFLVCVNGSDSMWQFDGATWYEVDDVSAVAITGVATADLSHVWSYGSRLWFIEKDSLTAWYLPTDSIAGAALDFSLAGIFVDGGELLFGTRWAVSVGDGLNDLCVFVSDQGEVAVYQGTDPSSASNWSKIGTYRMPRPMGKKAFIQAGADILIATETGLIPLSAALKTDIGAMETIALSRPINPFWLEQADSLTARGWEIVKDQTAGVFLISQPDPIGGTEYCLLINLVTGGWSRSTGWDAQCLAVFQDRSYFGSADGGVFLADSGGNDDGESYVATFIGQFDPLGKYGLTKTVKQVRPLFKYSTQIYPQINALADYSTDLPPPPAISPDGGSSVWDAADWDDGVWDDGAVRQVTARWVSAPATGSTIAPAIQMAFQGDRKPDVEMVALDAMFIPGAMVT